MTDVLALPDFKKYRYHFARLWWIPIAAGLLFAILAGGSGIYASPATTASAVLVPTEIRKETDLFIPLTRFEASVTVLRSNATRDAIEDKLGYKPSVTIDLEQASGVVRIAANGVSQRQAVQTRDAYVEALVKDREMIVGDSIQRARDDLGHRVSALQAVIDSIDASIEATPAGSAAAVLGGVDRAHTNALLLEARGNLAALESMTPEGRADVRIEAVGSGAGRKSVTGGLVRAIGGLITGLFIGTLIVMARAYFDERVRTRSDLSALGLPTYGVIDLSAPRPEAPVLELAVSISHHADSAGAGDYQVGLLPFEGVPGDRVVELVRRAAAELQVGLPKIATADTPGERIRIANESDGIVLLLCPGCSRQADLLNEAKIFRQSGTQLLGVSLVSKDARSARRSR